jgi:ParB family chromosome partitioning protein
LKNEGKEKAMSATRGLGRGFDSLIPTDLIDDEFDPTLETDEAVSKLREIAVGEIFPDEGQPRRRFSEEALEALAASIREHGVLQPIVVVKDGGKYKIVAGERRWRASKKANLNKIPAIVRSLTDQNRLELSLIENVQREDLNAIETATAYAKLKNQFNMTATEIAKRVGKSESAVVNTMRLLNLPDEAKKAMLENGLTEGQMRPLASASAEVVAEVLPRIVSEGLSAREVERMVAARKKSGDKGSAKKKVAGFYAAEEMKIAERLGLPTRIVAGKRGGAVTVKFKDETELKRLLRALGQD